MRLNTLIIRVLDWPCQIGDRFRDWLEAGKETETPNPLSRRCYLMSEAHMSGYRLIVGFENLEDLQAAHAYIARGVGPNTTAEQPARAGETR